MKVVCLVFVSWVVAISEIYMLAQLYTSWLGSVASVRVSILVREMMRVVVAMQPLTVTPSWLCSFMKILQIEWTVLISFIARLFFLSQSQGPL